jgi:hypothetical protein
MNAVTVGDLQLALENALLILEFTLAEQILSKLQRSVSRESFPVSAEDS